VQKTVEERTSQRYRWLDHQHPAADPKDSASLAQKSDRKLHVMEHVHHHYVAERARIERKALAVRHQVDPIRKLDVRRQDIRDPFFEVPDSAADLESGAGSALPSYALKDIGVDHTQRWLAVPNGSEFSQVFTRVASAHKALILKNAKITMRMSSKPWLNREIWVSP
jgi:hypothetical protein